MSDSPEFTEAGFDVVDPVRMFESTFGIATTEGNRVDVLRNGDRIFPAMLEAIAGARRSIDFLTFVYWTGDIAVRFAEALAERARAGVRVRVLLDAVGARRMDDALCETMTEAGCHVEWFRKVGDAEIGEAVHRTHRKVLVCDERIGFTGGVGIAEEWTGDARDSSEWRDDHFRVEGPAVDGLRAAFLADWVETGNPLFEPGVDRLDRPAPAGDTRLMVLTDQATIGWSTTALAFRLMMGGASRRLHVTTAYFTPDDATLDALCATARRGVDVRLLVPGPHADKGFVRWAGEATYSTMLEAGVRVRAFQPSMLHAKVMAADGRVAVVGSSNVNSRSISEDDEVLMAIFDDAVVGGLDGDFEDDWSRGEDIDPAEWAERGILQRMKEAATTVVSDVL